MRLRLSSMPCSIALPTSARCSADEPDLGADDDIGLQRLEHTAEIALGLAIAVERRGVEVVDAGLDGARRGALLVGRRALGEQPADGAGAIAQHRDLETGASEPALLHVSPPFDPTLPASLSTTT